MALQPGYTQGSQRAENIMSSDHWNFHIPERQTICGIIAKFGPYVTSLGCISGGFYNIILATTTWGLVLGWIYLLAGCCLPFFLCYDIGERRVILQQDSREVHYVKQHCCGNAHPGTVYLGRYGAAKHVEPQPSTQTAEAPKNTPETVQKWMADTVHLPQYTDKLVENGFDSVELLRYTSAHDLDKLMDLLNIDEEEHRLKIKSEVDRLKSNSTQETVGVVVQ